MSYPYDQLVVGAGALDVAGLLALVANPLTLGLCGTVARNVACLSTCNRRISSRNMEIEENT
ncbi:hypothetical protein BDW66DRAFT_145060 [Aspergillus desertorum]